LSECKRCGEKKDWIHPDSGLCKECFYDSMEAHVVRPAVIRIIVVGQGS